MPENAAKVFISYSHKDEALRDSLATHLSNLQWQGIISSWYDRQLVAGMEWDDKIKTELESADIILLLISPDFIASKYCRDVEIPIALQRHEARQAYVVPIILRPFDWFDAPFSKLQAFPKDAKPVTTWSNQDEAFVSVTQGIRTAAKLMLDYRKQEAEQKQLVRAQYLQKVEEVLSDGMISIVERDTLDELRETLGLTPEEAKEIETHAYEPFSRYEQSLNKYKQTLNRLIEKGYYPFSEEIEKDLENRQRDLGLKPEDAIRVSKPILDQAELDYQTKKSQVAEIAKTPNLEYQQGVFLQQQQERAEYEEKLQKRESELEKYRQEEQTAECARHLNLQVESYIRWRLAGSYLEQGKLAEAIIELQEAVRIEPDSACLRSSLGFLLYKKGSLHDAIVALKEATQIDPDYSDAYYNWGLALKANGKLDEAISKFQQAIKLSPNFAEAHFELGHTLCSLAIAQRENFNKLNNQGIDSLRKAIQINHNYSEARNAEVYNVLGVALYEKALFKNQGKIEGRNADEAIAAFRKAIQRNPNLEAAQANLDNVLEAQRLGKNSE
jgi:tetratricopeptide (TPR) repeat protein